MLTYEEEIKLARAVLLSFSSDQPLVVEPQMYRSIIEAGHFNDIINHVQVTDLVRASR
jgi:hypothetical protein